jgi:hypothetical protein
VTTPPTALRENFETMLLSGFAHVVPVEPMGRCRLG